MGLLSRLKQFFNKNIECDEELDRHIVFPLKKKKFIYLDKNILVRENTACVIVYRYRVCDVLMPGKYKVTSDNLPETFLRAKVNKLNKKGAKLKRIRVDVYYVNLKEIKDFEFLSDEPFCVKTADIGKVVGFLQGRCTFRVIDSSSLVKALLVETGKAKLNEIPNDIALWIGNKINKTIEKQKINANVILTQQKYVQELLNTALEDGYDNIGLYVKGIQLKSIDYPKKYLKKVNSYMSTRAQSVKYYDFNSMITAENNKQSIPVLKSLERASTVAQQNVNRQNKSNLTNSSFVFCANCGNKCDRGAKFCTRCGKNL